MAKTMEWAAQQQQRVTVIVSISLFLLLGLIHVQRNHFSRNLTPSRLYHQYESRLRADTQFHDDETLGMDEHLSKCWNDSPLPTLHHHGDPGRRKDWERNFRMKTAITDGITGYKESPKLFSTGQQVGLIYGGSTFKNPFGHHYWGFTSMSLWNETFTYTSRSRPACMICTRPPKQLPEAAHILEGDYVAFVGWMWGHYGHSTHDNLPWFAYLKEMASQDPTVKFILLDTGYARAILSTLDPYMATHRTVWVKPDEYTKVNGTITTIKNLWHRNDDPRFMDFLRSWSHKARDRSSQRNKVIYYDRRNPQDTEHLRYMRPDTEEKILITMKSKMKAYRRNEELVIFNGINNSTKERMTVEEQFALFKDATAIIGPHGSGLSGNLLWTNPMPQNCSDRVHVVEFIGEATTIKDTAPQGSGEYTSHWEFIRGWPFDYHHILYEPESTQTGLVINLKNFEDALDSIWGPTSREERKRPHPTSKIS